MSASQGTRRFARIDRLPPYVFNITAELKLAARRRGEDIIDMSMGNPDGATPPHIVAKLTEVAQRPDTHGYSASKGIPRLRRAISHWYKDRYAVDINPDTEAIVTIGSKEGLAHLMLATLDRGDTVLVPDPSYPIHIYGAVIAGADIRSVPVAPDVDFFAELEKAIRGSYPKPKMMIFGFPSNPTAQCVDLGFFERVIALAKKHDILVVHDLAYADIVYDGYRAPSIMEVPGAKDVAVEFFTLSKSYNMAGWRVGFMVGKMGWEFGWDAMHDLMDRAVDEQEVQAIRQTLLDTPGVAGVHDVRTRKMGDMVVVDAHLEVDAQITVEEGHDIAVEARQRVMQRHRVLNLMTHVDPWRKPDRDHTVQPK